MKSKEEVLEHMFDIIEYSSDNNAIGDMGELRGLCAVLSSDDVNELLGKKNEED